MGPGQGVQLRQAVARRGSIELSAGMLVTMILGILIITGGIVLVWRIVDEGTVTADVMSSRDRARIREQLQGGQLVASSPSLQEVRPGSSATFGVGVLNKLDGRKEFEILVEVYDANQQPVDWDVLYYPVLSVERNADEMALITVTPSPAAPVGEYVGLITVTADGQPYDSTRFFTVRVR